MKEIRYKKDKCQKKHKTNFCLHQFFSFPQIYLIFTKSGPLIIHCIEIFLRQLSLNQMAYSYIAWNLKTF